MKRLFVRPEFQGQGLGKTLAKAIIVQARLIGYSAMRLDTLPSMKEAAALYASLESRAIPAYYSNPVPRVQYFEVVLA
jgi:ribosomal protein S18 acetylase RimI-like enzyme